MQLYIYVSIYLLHDVYTVHTHAPIVLVAIILGNSGLDSCPLNFPNNEASV